MPVLTKKLRLAVLLSGSGTTLQNLIDLAAAGQLPAEIVLVVASRRDAFGLERARQAGIPTAVLRPRDFPSGAEFTAGVFGKVEEAGAELVCLAGFMVKIGLPARWANRVMNVHPALLPAFGGQGMYGHFVHEAVLAAGCKVTGASVHFVDREYDHGPIILQKPVEVRGDDTAETLAARVQAAEREIYPEAVRLFAAGRLAVEGRRVRILPEGSR
jgi:formyltetrahydrofolate-dependent phosphoribosylglycinamide formyltransferase